MSYVPEDVTPSARSSAQLAAGAAEPSCSEVGVPVGDDDGALLSATVGGEDGDDDTLLVGLAVRTDVGAAEELSFEGDSVGPMDGNSKCSDDIRTYTRCTVEREFESLKLLK
mmetsp:Transcript_38163/g.82984  ORF Transcript_38163/g.82984 Transcript_38163/m.82984 type:complete len:112 (+) Transcript_38163:749-1084(+)